MRLFIIISFFVYLQSCCTTNESLKNPSVTFKEMKILARDCHYSKSYVLHNMEIVPGSKNYKYDYKIKIIVSFSNCFKGLSTREFINIFGPPTEISTHGNHFIKYNFSLDNEVITFCTASVVNDTIMKMSCISKTPKSKDIGVH